MWNIIGFLYYLVIIVVIGFIVANGKPLNGVSIAILAIAALGGGILLEYRKRRASSRSQYSVAGISITLVAVICGLLVGRLLPTFELTFLPFGILYALLVFVIFGVPEMYLVRRVSRKLTSAYVLNGALFPYFSLGVAIQIALRT